MSIDFWGFCRPLHKARLTPGDVFLFSTAGEEMIGLGLQDRSIILVLAGASAIKRGPYTLNSGELPDIVELCPRPYRVRPTHKVMSPAVPKEVGLLGVDEAGEPWIVSSTAHNNAGMAYSVLTGAEGARVDNRRYYDGWRLSAANGSEDLLIVQFG